MQKGKRNTGITLVALIITIIVLLILAGVSIAALTGNNGILTRVYEAKERSKDAEDIEKIKIAVSEAQIGDNGYQKLDQNSLQETIDSQFGETMATVIDNKDGTFTIFFNSSEKMYDINKDGEIKEQSITTLVGKVKSGKIKIGEYIDYTPDIINSSTSEYIDLISDLQTYSGSTDNSMDTLVQETNLKWRILDVKDGKVRLISDTPTTSKISLYGQEGYNNGVYLLDETCQILYNNSVYTNNVSNLKIEDILKHLEYDYTQNETIVNNEIVKYGTTKVYEENGFKYYPSILPYEKNIKIDGNANGGLSASEQPNLLEKAINQAKNNITIQHTHLYKSLIEEDFENNKYYEIFVNKNGNLYNTYLLSSRCIFAVDNKASFNIYKISKGNIDSNAFYLSNNKEEGTPICFRPVITLNENVLVESGEGSEVLPYKLKI